MPVISIDVNMFWQMINFFILVVIFCKYFKKPLEKMLNSRKEKIISDIEIADENKRESLRLQKESEEILRKAKLEATEILKLAERKAEERKDAILEEAKAYREKVIKVAEVEVLKMHSDMKGIIQNEAKILAVQLAEKLIQKEIDPKIELNLIDGFIAEVGEER